MIDDLEALEGVGEKYASQLRRSGYPTVEAVAVTPVRELAEKTGIGINVILRIHTAARKMLGMDFITAMEHYERRKGMLRCSTGSRNLDDLLNGGIETQAITELIGEYGVGKSQLCMMLSVTVQRPKEDGGLEGAVAFIDTEGTFSSHRIYQIASGLGLDPSQVLNNIFLARAYNTDHQCLLIDGLFKLCPKEGVKLAIVDSMISHFRGEYIGREHLSERQQKLNLYLHKLLRLSEAYNLAVVITNQVQANPGQYYGDPNRPAGGHVMAHACTHRIYIRKSKGGTRLAKVIDSPYLPESSANFVITEKGIEDPPQ
jgi:DNA repair protein RadA